MTREEAIIKLKDILEEATETDDSVCYVTSDDADVLKLAIKALEYVERDDVLELLGEEPAIDKIRAEIEKLDERYKQMKLYCVMNGEARTDLDHVVYVSTSKADAEMFAYENEFYDYSGNPCIEVLDVTESEVEE